MSRSWFLLIPLLSLLYAAPLPGQTLSPTPPTDATQVGPWREAWYGYGREVRAWCATHELHGLTHCLTREMARAGVSPAWFATLYATAPKPALPPVPRSSTTIDCVTTSSEWRLTTTCTSY